MAETCPKYWINKYPTPEAWMKNMVSVVDRDTDWFKEAFDELEYLRRISEKVISEGSLPLVIPDEDDIEKLWRDVWRKDNPTDDYEKAITKFLDENHDFLAQFYPPPIINTIDYWYYIWDALHLRHDYPMENEDYQIYFTLMQTTHPDYPFRSKDRFVPGINRFWFVRRWSIRITNEVKRALLSKLLSNPDILEQCKKGNYELPPKCYPLENRDLCAAYANMLLGTEGEEKRKEKERDYERGRRNRERELRPLFLQVMELQKEGKEVTLIEP